jgi:hypothetical protein
MGVTTTSNIDCVRQNGLSVTIRELEEKIAHLKTYKEDADTEGMERTLSSLRLQLKRELSLS